MSEGNKQRKQKHSKKYRIIWAIIWFSISCMMVGISGSIISGLTSREVYNVSKESNLKDFNRILMQRYSVYALSGYEHNYNMDEIAKTNLHMGIYKSDKDTIDEALLKDPKNYEVNNFDKNFDFDKAQVFNTSVDSNTQFTYYLDNIYGSAFVEHPGGVTAVTGSMIDGYFYNWTNETFYVNSEGVLYPYDGDVLVLTNDTEEVDSKEQSEPISDKFFTSEKDEWKSPYLTVYIPEFHTKIKVSNIEIIDDFSMRDYIFYEKEYIVVENIENGYVYLASSPNSGNGDRYYYWVVSYINEPLVDVDHKSFRSSDLFVQAASFYDLFYLIRYPIIVVFGLFVVLFVLSGAYLFIHGVCALIRDMFKASVNSVGKAAILWRVNILLVGYMFFRLLAFAFFGFSRFVALLSMCEVIFIFIPLTTYIVWQLKKLEKTGEELAKGNLDATVDTKHMIWELKRHGEDLNAISDSIQLAVDDRMKSERMKTELITNVSHDIKTPLTSIINYVDLLSKENITEPKQKEYLEVLMRQSEKLKKLIEDLIEASKATTGNIEFNKMQVNPRVLLQQALGEYETKFAEKNIEVVSTIPDGVGSICVDGKYLWRIFENLFVNIYKYALPGTRAYVELEEKDDCIGFVFKNVSKDALNISVEELTERFVRGDSSRNTEGNGLGLAIVRSLAEGMDGTIDVSIDGDLFKVFVSFPKMSDVSEE